MPTESLPLSKSRAWRNALAITLLGCVLLGIGCFILLGQYLPERMNLFQAAVWQQIGFGLALAIILVIIVAGSAPAVRRWLNWVGGGGQLRWP